MDGTRPWTARVLIGLLALAIAVGLFAAASFLVSALMPLVARLPLHGPRVSVVISMMSSMTTLGVVMWLVLSGRQRKARAEPDVVPLPRLPKAG